MDAKISFRGTRNEHDVLQLNELAHLIERDSDALVELQEVSSQQGVKDGGITVAIAVLGLGASAISTFISILTYWQSQHPKYSLSMTRGNTTFTIDNISQEQMRNLIAQLGKESTEEMVDVQIRKLPRAA